MSDRGDIYTIILHVHRADDHPVSRMKSSIADPSRRNSGLETTSKSASAGIVDDPFNLAVPTGTVIWLQ